MKVTITAKLKLSPTPEQFAALRTTQLAYRDALNYVSRYAFEHQKMSNKVRLQEGTYSEVRARYKLPAQMACSVPRQVGGTYKTLWTKVKQNGAHRKAGMTKKRYKGLDHPAKFLSPTLTYQLGHDYSFKTACHVSILTLQGRVIVSYSGYESTLPSSSMVLTSALPSSGMTNPRSTSICWCPWRLREQTRFPKHITVWLG